MACNCNKKNYDCSGIDISSHCVTYEGPEIPLFGICKGDPITDVTEAITTKIIEMSEMEEAELASITLDNCNIIKNLLGAKDPTYANLIQVLVDYQCTVKQLIDGLQAEIDGNPNAQPYAYDLKCITPVGTPVNTDAIVQGIINKVCSLETIVNNLGTNVEQVVDDAVGDLLSIAITANGNRGITKSGSGSTTKINFYALVPPLTALPYVGPASNFDSNGKGLPGTSYDGWYFLNGNASTLDGRGRTLVAAVRNVPGPALDPEVDPTQPNNPSTNYQLGDKFGENYHKLINAEVPTHTHAVNDPGHTHGYLKPAQLANADKTGVADWVAVQNGTTSPATTGITLGSSGGGDIHNNRQPSLTITGYIMRFD